MPAGTYENRMALDGYDFEIEIKARMTVGAEGIDVDLAGSSPCSRFGINVPLNYAAAYAVFGIRCIIGPSREPNLGPVPGPSAKQSRAPAE